MAAALLAFFLLEPMLKLVKQEVENPVIVIGIDHSESMMMSADSAAIRRLVSEQLPNLTNELSRNYEVRVYTFGDAVNETPVFDFSGKETNISAFIREIENRYSNRNLGAVVLASDGLYNRGLNPVHQVSNIRAPLYTIALGDTTPQRDIVLREVRHNELAYLGNDFPVEVLVEGRGYPEATTAVTLSHNGIELSREGLRFDGEHSQQTVRFLTEATSTGIQRYTVTVESLEGEYTTANNSRDIYIEVLDSQQKILLLANAPHPDLRAIKLAIEANENYAIDLVLAGEEVLKPDDYHMVILHGLPSSRHPMSDLRNQVQNNIPAWFILTSQTNLADFNRWQTGVNIVSSQGSSNTTGASYNPTFSLFTMDAETGNHFGSLPPLSVPFGEYQLTAQGQMLMSQRIGSVKTDFPLWTFCDQNEWKTAILSGEGIWRWRTMSYADKGSHDLFNSLVQKTVQYLASRENKAFLRVSGAKSFRENEEIIFRAEVYNRSYELTTDPEVSMKITNADGQQFDFNFSRSGNAFRLNAGYLPAGNYTYRVDAQELDEQHEVSGAFSVVSINIESIAVVANHQLLYQMASSSAGEMLYVDEFHTLAERLQESREIASVVYERKELSDLINLRWIFFILLALFAIEWFIRKRQGAY